MTTKSHPQFIVAIRAELFHQLGFGKGIVNYPLEQLYREAPGSIVIAQRGALEQDPRYRQVLPYKVITQTVDGVQKIVAYRRLQTGGESRLYGLMSIGFGGHIDLDDVMTYPGVPGSKDRSTVDLKATVQASSRREIGEEVHFLTASGGSTPFTPEPQEIVPADLLIHHHLLAELGEHWHVSKDVHSVHVALVYYIDAPAELTFVSGEPEQIELLPAMTVEELLAAGYQMEEWTRLLLEYMAAQRREIEDSHANLLG